jgi:hypothetical protein
MIRSKFGHHLGKFDDLNSGLRCGLTKCCVIVCRSLSGLVNVLIFASCSMQLWVWLAFGEKCERVLRRFLFPYLQMILLEMRLLRISVRKKDGSVREHEEILSGRANLRNA